MSNKSTFWKIHDLLTVTERRRAWVLLGLMTIGMALETLGVGLVVPAITLMMQDDVLGKYPEVASLLSFLGSVTQRELIVYSMSGLVGVYLVKNVFLALMIWKQLHFAFDVQAQLSQRLFSIYLRQPYTFHLQRNSSELIVNVTGEVGIFAGILTSALQLFTESMVLAGIATMLLLVEPIGAVVVVLVLGGAAWGFHKLTRESISRWGAARQIHDGRRLQHLQQGLGGAKDVKLLGRESEFLAQFNLHNVRSAQMWKFQSTVQHFPRLMFELLAVAGLAILVLSMVGQGRSMESIIPVLGLFAAAAFRLMPSANRVLGSLQAFRYSLPVVDTLYKESKLSESEPVTSPIENIGSFNDGLNLKNVVYYYPSTSSPALDGVTLDIKKGESVGLIGESGSGKSTLVDIILGLLVPNSGAVEVDGTDIHKVLRWWQDKIGYVPQSIYLTDDSLRRNVAFGLPEEQIDDLAVRRALKAAQLETFVSTLPQGIETVVGERGVRLSGGQRQRIGIARALYHDPEVLVLDEATSALDVATENGVMESVVALQGTKTIIVVAHRLSTVANCDRLFRLAHGRVIEEGEPSVMLSVK